MIYPGKNVKKSRQTNEICLFCRNLFLPFNKFKGKKFNLYDVSASIVMSIGLIFFTLADIEVQPNFEAKGIFLLTFLIEWHGKFIHFLNVSGVVLIFGALIADAAIGNVQEKQMKLYKASNIEVVSIIF